jgi:NADPH2:quinone reductase
MATAIVLRAHGAPDALRAETVDVAAPGAGEIRIRQTAVGVNYHDAYVRSGLYRTLALPGIPGIEAAGVVEALGAGVAHLRVGDRVAYVTRQYGAYASERVLPARLAVPLPAAVSEAVAATNFLKGLTAEMLLHRVHRVEAGQTVLVHAAAGGVGSLLARWASRKGATVIGTAGSAEKLAIARAAGCAHAIDYRREDFVARVREITEGRGVQVAYDAVGADTFAGSLECLALRGHLVNYGQASGPVPPFEVARLMARSNSLTRPSVFAYTAEDALYQQMAATVFAALADGTLPMDSGQVFALHDAGAAHLALESRTRSGAIWLQT